MIDMFELCLFLIRKYIDYILIYVWKFWYSMTLKIITEIRVSSVLDCCVCGCIYIYICMRQQAWRSNHGLAQCGF